MKGVNVMRSNIVDLSQNEITAVSGGVIEIVLAAGVGL
jgi:hypothetical protein